MSELRKELTTNVGKSPCLKSGTAYFMILQAVEAQRGLVHGQLHAHGEHCAIGSFFEINSKLALPSDLIDEVAAVNDSMPGVSERTRKLRMLNWLRWKLKSLGMPGYERAKAPR